MIKIYKTCMNLEEINCYTFFFETLFKRGATRGDLTVILIHKYILM